MMRNDTSFDERAAYFDRLDWVNDDGLLVETVRAIENCGTGKLLGLGIGTGIVESHLKTHFEVTGLDCSPKMLDACARRNPKFELVEGDIERVAEIFTGRQFDVVFARATLGHLRIAPVLRCVREVLAPRGKLVLCESIAFNQEDEAVQLEFHNLLHPGHVEFPSAPSFLKKVRQAGFQIDFAVQLSTTCCVSSLAESFPVNQGNGQLIIDFLSMSSLDRCRNWNIKGDGMEMTYERPWLLMVASSADGKRG
jgi:ubiquinone/menaquinone biosynthesis C-methylase UbiE